MTTAIVDIETDSLNATKIHCIVARSYETNKVKAWVGQECSEFASWSQQIDTFVMHNGISFDAPVLNRLLGCNIKLNQIRDTLIESQLYNPIRDGGHSLEAWGKTLGFEKGDFHDFSDYSPEMLEYCKRDTEVTRLVAQKLEKEGKAFKSKAYELECKVRAIVDKQQKNGFAFKLKEAMILQAQLQDELHELERKAEEDFEPNVIELKTKTKYIPFNIASRKQIAERLQAKGWKPKQMTDKGNVIINEAVLSKIDMPEAKMFNRYFLLQKRTGLIKSWIMACEEDNRVRGKVMTLRTITGRMAHAVPNMAQVPAIYSPYGRECRSLWTVDDESKYRLVGVDASGLELRCLAHYMNDPEYTNIVLTGDVHTANQQAAGLQTRDQAKTFIYAFLYGAGATKIGKVVGGGPKKGQQLITKFLNNMPALKRLREQVAMWSVNGTVPALDGRLLHIRSEHAAVNTLLQGAGAIVCKQWLVHIMERVIKAKLNVRLVASIHDEYQFEVAIPDIERFCRLTKEAMTQTTKTLKMKCELDCDYKVGKTWAETH
jgi:DNA polymerase I-like protein with 3'-5' exonuclease and polymerase domains